MAGKHTVEVDLTPLIRRSSNYIVKTDKNTVFFINVCRPLLPVPGLACTGGPSVCMTYIKNGNYYEEKVHHMNIYITLILDLRGSKMVDFFSPVLVISFLFIFLYNDK